MGGSFLEEERAILCPVGSYKCFTLLNEGGRAMGIKKETNEQEKQWPPT